MIFYESKYVPPNNSFIMYPVTANIYLFLLFYLWMSTYLLKLIIHDIV